MRSTPREVDLFIFLTYVDGKSVSLICMQQISVVKEYSICRHDDSHHSDKLRNFQGKAKMDKVKELLSGSKKQQSIFSHNVEVSDEAVIASCLIAKEIAVASKPFTVGKFVKNCLTKKKKLCVQKTPVIC